jgi:hypothetical protein
MAWPGTHGAPAGKTGPAPSTSVFIDGKGDGAPRRPRSAGTARAALPQPGPPRSARAVSASA